MSISPPSDIVLDVLRASDPARQQAAVQKLTKTAVSRSQPNISPTAALPVRSSFESTLSNTQLGARTSLFSNAPSTSSSQVGSAHRQFEKMVLQDFVQRMLPSKAEATFGQGTAGNIWKSWMADAVATEIADAGGIGISKILQPTPVALKETLPIKPQAADVVVPDSKPHVEARQAGPVSGLRDIVAKLQEIFLNIFGHGKSAEAGDTKRASARPAFDV